MMDFFTEYYYTYVLYSLHDGKHYIGYTHHLLLRMEQHEKGEVPSTRSRRPLKLIYFEACLTKEEAMRREKYFKTHYGRIFLKSRLQNTNKLYSCSIRIPRG